MINLIAAAIPVFLLLIAIEYLVAYKKKQELYVFNDFANNISAGSVEQLCGLFMKVLTSIAYIQLSSNYALFNISTNRILHWLILWLMVDFFYYWMHRSSHRCNFLWAGHSVHHQSEQYNLSIALRQGVIQTAFSWFFYLPIALIGFPFWMFAIVSSLNTLYQFWIHTMLINKMGPFEWLFNTPSHHRVHHGTNPQYIDKNYAGTLIIWDKLFGTFEKELEPVTYGVTDPLDSWCPFYANIKVLLDTYYYTRSLKTLKQKIMAFIMPPEWIVEQLGDEKFAQIRKSNTRINTTHYSPLLMLELSICIILITFILNSFIISSWQSISLVACLAIRLIKLGRELAALSEPLLLDCLSICLAVPTITSHLWFSVMVISMVLCLQPLSDISSEFIPKRSRG